MTNKTDTAIFKQERGCFLRGEYPFFTLQEREGLNFIEFLCYQALLQYRIQKRGERHMEDRKWMQEEGEADTIKLQFPDLWGHLKSVEIPGQRKEMLNCRPAAVEAGAVLGEHTMDRTCFFLKPDWETQMHMVWEAGAGETDGVLCSLTDSDGNPVWCDSREILKQALRHLAQEGLAFRVRLKCEFFLFHTDEEARATTVTHDTAGRFDAGAIDLAESIRRDIAASLMEAGISVEYSAHAGAPGQHVFCLAAREALQAADEFQFFQAAVKRIAKSRGLHASFMPRPLNSCAGSSLIFDLIPQPESEEGWEEKKGLLNRAARRLREYLGELALVTNPTVNSYRRLAAMDDQEKHSDMLVEGTEEGIRFHMADPSANLYLALAAVLSAGFSEQPETGRESRLPSSLFEAAKLFSKSTGMRHLMGSRLFSFYHDKKTEEWERFSAWVTDWEIKEYLSEY